jgi:hypothetical protein
MTQREHGRRVEAVQELMMRLDAMIMNRAAAQAIRVPRAARPSQTAGADSPQLRGRN